MRKKIFTALGITFFSVLPLAPALALEILDDSDLAGVSGQDGLSVTFWDDADAGISLESAALLHSDPNPATQNETGELGFRLSSQAGQPFLKRLDTSRSLLNAELDVAADSGVPVTRIALDWARSRLEIGAINLAGYSSGVGSGSFGHYAIDLQGQFEMLGRRFLDHASPDYGSSLLLNIGAVDPLQWAPGSHGALNPGAIYWRQAGAGAALPEMTMSDFSFYFSMPDGRYGFDSNGLVIESRPGQDVGFSLFLDFHYDGLGGSPFALSAADKPMLYWGWRGHWQDFKLQLKGNGGRQDGSGKGFNAAVRFNYSPDFVWAVGEGGDSPAYLEFGNWTALPGNPYGIDAPFVALDALAAGSGLTGLCWGNDAASSAGMGACSGTGLGAVASNLPVQTVNVRGAGDPNALGLTVRDLHLAAYSSSVDIIDRTLNPNNGPQNFEWALVYTLADLDAEVFLSPYADGKSIRFDAAVSSQTSYTDVADRWRYGSNFMIGNSTTNYAIGLMGADVLAAIRGGRIGMTTSGLTLDTNLMRYQIRGMLGGGAIPDMAVPQSMAYVDANIEADRYVLNLGPATDSGDQYLSYSGFVNFANLGEANFASVNASTGNHVHDDGTYISFSEPSFDKLGIDIRFANLTGPIEVTDGQFDLQGESEGELRVVVSNKLRIGTSAKIPCDFGVACTPVAATTPLQVERLEFGGQNLGTLVMPHGVVRAEVSLMPQVP